jgi:hypothetical protein
MRTFAHHFTTSWTHPITKRPGSAWLLFVKRNDAYPNGVRHILRETRAQRRVKVGTDLGGPRRSPRAARTATAAVMEVERHRGRRSWLVRRARHRPDGYGSVRIG